LKLNLSVKKRLNHSEKGVFNNKECLKSSGKICKSRKNFRKFTIRNNSINSRVHRVKLIALRISLKPFKENVENAKVEMLPLKCYNS